MKIITREESTGINIMEREESTGINIMERVIRATEKMLETKFQVIVSTTRENTLEKYM
jgi:hypothetical protein